MIGRQTKLTAGVIALLTLAGCGGDGPGELWGSLNYTVCRGRAGTCGGAEGCCATADPIQSSSDAQDLQIECVRRPGDATGQYLDFSIVGTFEADGRTGRHGLRAKAVLFAPASNEPVMVRDCDDFSVVYENNDHKAESCTAVAVNSYDAGGCEVMIQATDDDTINGSFRCKDVQLPGQPQYVSTIQASGLGYGAFQIRNCVNRL
jgi:hypothetical protein